MQTLGLALRHIVKIYKHKTIQNFVKKDQIILHPLRHSCDSKPHIFNLSL